jgi:hypothetical protein
LFRVTYHLKRCTNYLKHQYLIRDFSQFVFFTTQRNHSGRTLVASAKGVERVRVSISPGDH